MNLSQFPNCEKAFGYADDIISGKIVSCHWVKKACLRFKRDLQDPRFYFDYEAAERACKYIQRFPHIKGPMSGTPMIMSPWQLFCIANPFGFKWAEGESKGLRRFKKVFILVARKQGKSSISAPVGIYMLSLDKEAGPEVYSVASKRDQARIVFDVARAMVNKTPSFVKNTSTEVFAHHITHDPSVGVFKPLSSDSNTSDGLNPHFVILDEVHAFKDRNLYGVMETAIGARSQPMLWSISTAGFDDTGICYELQVDLEKILNQEFDDPTQFGMIFTLDKGDDFRDEKVWIKANPNLGVSVKSDYIRDQVNSAIRNPGNRTNILTKHFNIWCTASENFFDIGKFDTCVGKVDIEELKGKPCYVGIDLSSKIDLAAMVAVFYINGKYVLYPHIYLPEAAVRNPKNSSYEAWAERGQIIMTPGETISNERIQDDLLKWKSMFKIRAAHYDPWNAAEMGERMSKKHINMVEFLMRTANFSEPMKKLDAEIRNGNFLHDGNPVVRWNFGNVVAKKDANENVFPRKQADKHKIDIAVATIMAMAGWGQEKQGSVYEKRGLIIV